MLAVWKREFQNYFLTPIGYVFMAIFLLVSGVFFFIYNLSAYSADMTKMFSTLSDLFMLMVPILTMRLLSEEKKNKTDQLLLTSPVSIRGMVMGKFLAAMSVFLIAVAVTLVYALIIVTYSVSENFYTVTQANWGLIFTRYTGFVALCSCYIAIGVLMSALTENQVSAAVLTLGVNMLLQVLEALAPTITIPYLSFISTMLSWLSLYSRYTTFSAGMFSFANLVYYASFVGIMLFLTVRVIDKRRWSEG